MEVCTITIWTKAFVIVIRFHIYKSSVILSEIYQLYMYNVVYKLAYKRISQTSMAQTCSWPRKLVLDMGSSSNWKLIIEPGQETNGII